MVCGARISMDANCTGWYSILKMADPVNKKSFRMICTASTLKGRMPFGVEFKVHLFMATYQVKWSRIRALLTNPKSEGSMIIKNLVWVYYRDVGMRRSNLLSNQSPYGIVAFESRFFGRLRWAKGKLCVFRRRGLWLTINRLFG